MNESELRAKWQVERPMYQAWGQYVVDTISNALHTRGHDPSVILKIEPKVRAKGVDSLADKAFRRTKNYPDPYYDIEDKVGVRFVVLLTEDIKPITHIIESITTWDYEASRDYKEEQESAPLSFAYQSVHFILRPISALSVKGLEVAVGTPCEVQVRTLLQHAHAELTHDSIYKARKEVKPSIHRAVAKSMALIECTDDYFTDVRKETNAGRITIKKLDGVYRSFTDREPVHYKSSYDIWGEFEDLVTEELIENITDTLEPLKDSISMVVNKNYNIDGMYQQGAVLFVYWLIMKHRRETVRRWPLNQSSLENLAVDLGMSTENWHVH